ncbi:MAG TPA: thioredoxin-disulfide reductase [bacterium]|nr:thioredoxin-disulfide reductase [bacterium]
MEKVVIIGSGPAGYTAALYASRANLSPLLIDGPQPGGQLTTTTEVENFPGFPEGIQGPQLTENMKQQAARFGTRYKTGFVTKVDFSSKPFKLWVDETELIESEAVIVATGATAKYGGVPREMEMIGHGVSACATCDGFFFKNQDIAVVGGGDSAMEEANFLTRFAKSVTLIHRREEFRASKVMLKRAQDNPKIKWMLNSAITEIVGEKSVEGLKVKDLKTGAEKTLPFTGLFFAIGHTPNTAIFKGVLDMDEVGYLKLPHPPKTMTNIPGVFAAGDVADHYYRQAISAAGMGCMAAIEAERWLEAQGE